MRWARISTSASAGGQRSELLREGNIHNVPISMGQHDISTTQHDCADKEIQEVDSEIRDVWIANRRKTGQSHDSIAR